MTKLRSILSYICCCFGRGSPIKEDDGYTPLYRKQRPYWQFNPSSRRATSLFAETYIPTPNQSVNRNTNITTDIHTRRNTDQDVDQFLVDFPYEFDSTDANRIQSTQRRIPSVSSIQDTRHLHQHRRLEHHQTKTFTQSTEGINPPKTDTPRQINTEQHTCSQNEIDPTTIDLPQLSHHSIPSISGKQEARNVHRYQQYSHDQPNLNQKSTERTDTIKIATSKKKHTDPDTYLEYKSNQTLNNRGESSHHPIPSLSGKQDTLNQHQNLQYEQNQSNKKIQPIERQDTLKTDAFKKEQIDPDTDSYSGFNPTVIDSKPSSHHSISSISRKQETQNVHHYQQYGHDQSNHIKLAIATTGSQKTDTSKKKYKNTDLDSKLNQIVDNRTESRNLATSSISGKQNICSHHQHQQHKHDQISKYIEPEERVDTFKTEVSKKKQIDQDTDSQHSFSRAITNRTESHRSIPSVSGKEDPDNMHQQYEDNQSNHIKQSTGTTDTLKIDASEKKYKNPDTDSDSILDQNVKKIYLTESSLPIYSMSAKQDILSLYQNQQYGYNQTNVSIESVYQYIIDNVEISTSEDSDENRDSNDGFNRTVINRPDSPQQQVPLTLHGQDTNDLHQSHYCKQNQTNPTKEPAGRIDTLKVDVLEKADRDLDTDSHDGLFPAVVAHQQSQHPNPSILGIQDTRKLHHSDPDKQNLTTVITQPRDSPDTDATKTSTERDNCKEIDSSHATNQTVINRTKSPPEIQDSRHLDQPQQHQPNQTDRVIQPASKLDSPDSRQSQSIKRRQASTSSKYSNLSTPNREKNYRRDPPINLSSTSTVKQDILAKLNITWNTNLQNNHFIRSKIRNLPQSYQDILTKIVKDCRRTIKNHLRPHWLAVVKRYVIMMEKDSKNKSSYDSSNTAVSKEADLEKMTLKSSLEVFIMQKIGFDKAIFSCFNKIINIYHNAHNKEIDLNDNQTIQDVIAKVNLEIDRICEGLPIYANRNEIQQRIKKHQTIIIKGQTGSGKSTQVPQYVAELNIGKVICTQPTKIAALRLDNYLAGDYSKIDSSVDCEINNNFLRYKSHSDSIISFVTASMLLDTLVDDPILSSYGCVIVDEAHQRSLDTDILLAFLQQVLTRRHDLKLIVISADIDTKLFSRYFNDCPTISVPNTLFPVDIKWCYSHVSNNLDKALDTVVEIHNRREKGDILVFLVIPDNTEKACVEIKKRFPNNSDSIIALSLHDHSQGNDLQNILMIDSSGRRKVIFATNCAETSITIPGIRYVVDTGKVKERIYNDKSNYHSLSYHPICQTSAIQRCGRAGRTRSGICYRLYSQQVYDNMSLISEPEVKRVDLSNMILKMIELGVADILNFNFIESPLSQNIIHSLDILHKLSAISSPTSPLSLTSKGKVFCQLPLEPRLSALIMDAKECNILPEGIVIASALSISCILHCRFGSEDDKCNLDAINRQFCYRDGDVISTAAVYVKWRSLNGKRELKNWCYKNKVNLKLMKQLDGKVQELEQSLSDLNVINKKALKIPSQLTSQSRDKLRQLIFQCYDDQLALFSGSDKLGYVTMRSDNQCLVHKLSTLLSLGVNPRFIVYQEILTTWDHFLINITPVDEEWLQSKNDNYAQIENMPNDEVTTQKIDNLGSIILSNYDTNSIDRITKNLLQDENIRCSITKNVKDGNLDITTIKSKMSRLLETLNKSIMYEKEKLIKAVKILSKEANNGACRLIIGRGIIVKDILLPNDCIEFKITLRYTGDDNPDEDTATDAINEVRALIMSCGQLAVDVDTNAINKSKDYKIIRLNKIVYQEISSQSLLKAIDMKVVSGYEVNIENGSLADCSISRNRILVQFRWPRRPRNGKGTITCRDRSAAINVQNDFPLTIYNQTIHANFQIKRSRILHLCYIPNFITEADIRLALPRFHREAITEIHFHREASTDDEISSSDLESKLRKILDKSGFYGTYSKVTVKSTSSIKKNPNIMADVIFRTYDDAVLAVQALNDEVYEDLINEPISVRLGHSRIIKCHPEIYACVVTQLDRVLEDVKNIKGDQDKFVHIDIYPSNKKYPLTSITIRSWNEFSLNETVRQITNIMEPVKVPIDVAEILDYLNTKDGNTILTYLSHHFAAYAKIDWKLQSILIYGGKEAKEQASDYCQKEINRLRSKCKIIELVGNNKAKDLVKIIIKRYGVNLKTLLRSSGADAIQLNRKNKTLTVIGEKESFTSVLNQIDSCCNTSDESKDKSSDDKSVNTCVVCYDEIGDNHYRLQYCGHLYCQECITNQMKDAIKSCRFPLNCASCNEEFVIGDLEQLLSKLPQSRLFDVLLNEFVRRHSTMWYFCPTPECESVYKRSDRIEVFTCPLCQKKTCRKCDTEDHSGYDCNEIKLIRKNPDASIEKFLSKNSENVKKCPKCNAAIEKSYGCHHMECHFCHTHFCWLCSAGYETSKDCYRHLKEKHGSYV